MEHELRKAGARHGKTARKGVTRLRRPVAGPDLTTEIPQRIHTLAYQNPELPSARPENVVNGVKTIMVNGPLRRGARVAAVLKEAEAKNRCRNPRGASYVASEPADGPINWPNLRLG